MRSTPVSSFHLGSLIVSKSNRNAKLGGVPGPWIMGIDEGLTSQCWVVADSTALAVRMGNQDRHLPSTQPGRMQQCIH
jgi:hypothetical protein